MLPSPTILVERVLGLRNGRRLFEGSPAGLMEAVLVELFGEAHTERSTTQPYQIICDLNETAWRLAALK
jgi:hypothetical protein